MVEFVVTLDEAIVHVGDAEKNSEFCYKFGCKKIPEEWLIEKREKFDCRFMVVATMTGR